MFRRTIEMHRSSTRSTISLPLQLIFLLHTCTALFTIVNALQQNDNEAIIQLSVDSIHVVKSSDNRFQNIEENFNDNEEKNLLLALLNSFDDQTKTSRSIQNEQIIENPHEYDLLSINNCSSMSFNSDRSSSDSSPIRFIPSSLYFAEQSIGIPCMQTVTIINDHHEPLELYSLSGTTVQFYSSFFTEKILSSHGGNTTIRVYFLPRTLGITKSTFNIQTSHGTFQYYVNGIGKANPFRLRPLIGAIIPLNSTFEYQIQFYNPYNRSIDIEEIYTSDENLLLDISSTSNDGQWHFEPFQSKFIVKISYFAWILDRLHAFYCIKTSENDTIILPVEIQVENQRNLYSNVDILEFSPDQIVRTDENDRTIPIYVINQGLNPVTISNIRVTTKNINYVTIHYENVLIPPDIHRWNKVAELTLHSSLIDDDVKSIYGTIQIFTLPSIHDAVSLEIPFYTTILHGSLEYERQSTYFYISSNNSTNEECRSIEFTNRFDVPMAISNISTDKIDLLSQYVKMKFFSPYVYLQPGQTAAPLCLTILQRSSASISFTNFEAQLKLHSNLSSFYVPISLYSGLLSLNLIHDNTNGGIRRSETNFSQFFIASIPIHTSRTVKFVLINTNPIDIHIEKISRTFSHTSIQLFEMQLLNGTAISTLANGSFNDDSIASLLIPERHQAVFALTIQAESEPAFFDEILTFQTSYENLKINLKYRLISGSINVNNDVPLHIDVFPNRIGTIDLFLHNGLNKPTDVTQIEFPMYGKCFSFIWNNTASGRLLVEPKQSHHIGKLTFDMIPLCDTVQIPSESTCYCGLNNHPEFKQTWDEHVSLLDTDEFDHFLVSKFRNLWNEWTSFVRNQKLETNIWLMTDQANISRPITIGFVWPSVLEFMSSSSTSRTPIVLDYFLTLINTTKTQNVIINNPSSLPLSFTVELIKNYESRTHRHRRHGNGSNFQFSTISERVDRSDGLSKFVLQPNEQMIYTISYQPTTHSKDDVFFVIRNNLTIIESILLSGEGVSGSLTVGNRKAGSSNIPIVLEMNEKQYKFCSDRSTTDGVREHPKLDKIVTLRNTGHVKIVIHDVSFGNTKCSGHGFSVVTCSNIELDANENYDLTIFYQPDYLSSDPEETLTLNTNIGLLTFPIVVRIPKRVLATCFQHLPRPIWELRTSLLCICSVSIIVIIVIISAFSEARELICHYLARIELQKRSTTMKENIFNLKSFTCAPVQPETRERAEITSTPVNTMSPKKDISNHDHKPKVNENKPKRSVVTTNGNKDNGETPSKTLRSPEPPNPPSKPVAVSPKAAPHKSRRGTIDNGSSKAGKHQTESTNVKSAPIRPQKPLQSDATATTNPIVVTPLMPLPRSPTPPLNVPSSPETDNESGPFMIARPKRISTKVKESTNNVQTTKTPSADNPPVPIRSAPSPPSAPPVPIPIVIPKVSVTNDSTEMTDATNPNLDESWHMVSSNRTQRKNTNLTNNRREPNEEYQTAPPTTTTTTKRNKTPPANNASPLFNDWDEPETPDDESSRVKSPDFSRYISQTESNPDESVNVNDWAHGSPPTMSDLPCLLSFSAVPDADLSDNTILKPTAILSSVVTEDIESIPYLHHGPGPIQRPNKLNHSSATTNVSTQLKSSFQSPGTADVLDHLNRFIYDDNEGRSSVNPSNNTNSNAVASTLVNDLTPTHMPWAYSPSEWTPKMESSWPLSTFQSPNLLSSTMENPFTMIPENSSTNSSRWSNVAVGTSPSRFVSPTNRTQHASAWNDFFSSTVPSTIANESAKLNTNPWAQYMRTADPSSPDVTTLNGHATAVNNTFWNLSSLSTDSVVPQSSQNQQGVASQIWWTGLSSDENNNTNHRNDDNSNARDQSRWDFAR